MEMMQTLNPSSTAKTAEIMARYRPIAPRPEAQMSCSNEAEGSSSSSSSSMSPTIQKSHYLRNVWPHLQSRPTRTRKRGRTSLGPPPAKRSRTLLQGLSPPPPLPTGRNRLSIQGFPPAAFCPLPGTLVTLPLAHMIDLNKAAEVPPPPEEKDLLGQLQKPPSTNYVISPRPVRLIGSSISIRAIKDEESSVGGWAWKKASEVEKELECEALPALVSDSNNKVRLVNSAYKEMVGQPVCPWLQSMVTGEGACTRICGEVALHLPADTHSISASSFSFWGKIEWGGVNSVDAFGEAMRLACHAKDYMFAWRFHTSETAPPPHL